MNLSEATKLVAILKGVYLREQFTEESPRSFLWLLGDLSLDDVLEAARIHGMTNKWCPTAGEIREIIDKKANPKIPGGDAWEIVQKQIRKHGYASFGDCDFGDESIALAVRRVGWKRLCLDEDQKFIRRDFDAALESVQEEVSKNNRAAGALGVGSGSAVKSLAESS